MPKSLFESLGYKLGRKAAQVKDAFILMGGDEEQSLRAEIRLGSEMAATLVERTPMVQENDNTRYAAHIGRWLAARVREKKLPFSVKITAEPEPNALALPGGPIFLSRPLLEICQDQRDQVAFIIAHEMAHIVRRHAVNRIIKDAALALLLRQTPGRHAAAALLNQAGRKLLTRAFSRENELEADTYARDLVKTAGGDPLAAETLLEKLSRLTAAHSPTLAGDYFSTHPPFAERIANLQNTRSIDR
jgi:beta-barrel assembly-enhancing protease